MAQSSEPLRLVNRRHHRCHHPGVRRRLRTARQLQGRGDTVELTHQQFGVTPGNTQAAHTQRRVLLVLGVDEGHRFVGTGVQCPYHDLALRERPEDRRVLLRLLLHRRFLGLTEEAELGTEKPDPLRH